jgi:pimeloyl-ACP methyl ester carboxylesterase
MMERRRLQARGLVFDVLAAGDPAGEPVLLLHGFPQTAACWTRLAGALAAAGCWVLAPDQRGYSPGARPAAVRDYRMPELVADALALADRAGVGRFHLVGHDWGGAVAWHLAARHPERVATLTAVSTPHPRAMAAALRASTQPLRSAYIAFFRTSRLPELVLGARELAGLRLVLTRSGLGPASAEAYARALAGPGALAAALAWYRAAGPSTLRVPAVAVPPAPCGGRVTRLWAGGPPRRPPAGSPAPTTSRSWTGLATGCPSSTRPSWPTSCCRTCASGRSAAPAARDGRRDPGRGRDRIRRPDPEVQPCRSILHARRARRPPTKADARTYQARSPTCQAEGWKTERTQPSFLFLNRS